MMPRNHKNECLKHKYADYLKQANGKAAQTIRQIEKSIQRYETFTNCEDFGTFNQVKAMGFKADLATQHLAKATILSTVTDLKRFFGWLALETGYKSKIKFNEVEFLSLSEKDVRAAKSPANRPAPTLEQVLRVVENMPANTVIEMRNRALVAFIAVTGIRDGAVISLRLKHFDPARNLITQNPNEVKTKFSKHIHTYLLPLNDGLKTIVLEWVNLLRNELLWGNDDPLFPKTAMTLDSDNCFIANGLLREFWTSATPVRDVFKAAFQGAGLPYFTPHTFRHMLVQVAYQRNLSNAQLKAWSQNLGHESLLTTLSSYGTLPPEEQGRLVQESIAMDSDVLQQAAQLINSIKKQGSSA
jgi:integrase/recombinase XerD